MDGVSRFGLGFVSGQAAGQVVELPENAEIGQGPGVGVRIADPGLAPRHAQIYVQEGSAFLLDLGSPGGTFLDGALLVPGTPQLLVTGSLVRFGEAGPVALFHTLATLQRDSGELVLQRSDSRETWTLTAPVTVGRSESCEVRVETGDAQVDPAHLHLLPAFGHLIATDLGSPKGTWSEAGRLVQAAIRPGQGVVLGGEGGPMLRLLTPSSDSGPSSSQGVVSHTGPAPIPELFAFDIRVGVTTAEVVVASKAEVSFGSFAGINDFETVCFPRDLEDEGDAMERSEAIGPQHGAFVLRESDLAIRDEGYAPTHLNGTQIPAQELVEVPEEFQLDLGGVLGLRGRVFRHPGLAPRAPAFGVEASHPVECMSMERMGDGPDSRLYLVLVRQAALGSSDDAAIRIDAPGVGALHALLYLQHESLWITQLGQDPVAVDGVPLAPQTTVPLKLGSEVYLGTARLKIRDFG